MTFRVLPSALADLEDIDDWLTEHHGETTSAQVQEDLLSTIELIAQFPHIGRANPRVTTRPVRFFSHWPYWIVYQPGSSLLVHRVLHAARDLPKLFKEEPPQVG